MSIRQYSLILYRVIQRKLVIIRRSAKIETTPSPFIGVYYRMGGIEIDAHV